MSSVRALAAKAREFASLFRERVFVTLVCYVDETGVHDPTGSHPGAEVAAVAGYLSHSENWEDFTAGWQSVLEAYHVETFHMSDFSNEQRCAANPGSPYHGWPDYKRHRFIHDLIQVATEQTLCGISGLISVRDYHRLMPPLLKEMVVHPYYFCFQLFFEELLHCVKCEFEEPFAAGERIAFFFDQQDEFQLKAHDLFMKFKEARDIDDRMGTIAFASKKECVPLQAADLLASRTRKMFGRRLRGDSPLIKPGSWDEALLARGHVHTPSYNEEAFKTVIAYIAAGGATFHEPTADDGMGKARE